MSGDPTFVQITSLRKAAHREPLRPGRYAIINGTRVQITSMTTSKPGKHGAAKTMVSAIDPNTG